MKMINSLRRSFVKYACLAFILLFLSQAKAPLSPDPEIFTGTSPCGAAVRPLLSIPANIDCEMIKWHLSLVHIPRKEALSTFQLKYSYGMSQGGTQGLVNDGATAELKGNWISQKNTGKLPGDTIIQLKPSDEKNTISFIKLDNNLMHLTDKAGALMIGNAGWSYTLNRAK